MCLSSYIHLYILYLKLPTSLKESMKLSKKLQQQRRRHYDQAIKKHEAIALFIKKRSVRISLSSRNRVASAFGVNTKYYRTHCESTIDLKKELDNTYKFIQLSLKKKKRYIFLNSWGYEENLYSLICDYGHGYYAGNWN